MSAATQKSILLVSSERAGDSRAQSSRRRRRLRSSPITCTSGSSCSARRTTTCPSYDGASSYTCTTREITYVCAVVGAPSNVVAAVCMCVSARVSQWLNSNSAQRRRRRRRNRRPAPASGAYDWTYERAARSNLERESNLIQFTTSGHNERREHELHELRDRQNRGPKQNPSISLGK